MNMAADAADNSPTFSSASQPSLRTPTVQQVSYSSNAQWAANTWYTLSPLASVIQEVVNRTGWQSGNSLSLILKGTGNAWGRMFVTSYDAAPADAPTLIITYTTAGGSPTPTPPARPNRHRYANAQRPDLDARTGTSARRLAPVGTRRPAQQLHHPRSRPTLLRHLEMGRSALGFARPAGGRQQPPVYRQHG